MKALTFFATLVLAAPMAIAGDTVPVQQAQKAGIKQCLPAVKKVSEFLIEGASHGAHGSWVSTRPDKQVYASTVERTLSDGSQILSIVVTPTPTGECATVYERIVYFPESCLATAKNTFPAFEFKGELNQRVSILSSKDSGDAYLMPIANGCLVVRREVISDGNNP